MLAPSISSVAANIFLSEHAVAAAGLKAGEGHQQQQQQCRKADAEKAVAAVVSCGVSPQMCAWFRSYNL
jgi:hypothetical protein